MNLMINFLESVNIDLTVRNNDGKIGFELAQHFKDVDVLSDCLVFESKSH